VTAQVVVDASVLVDALTSGGPTGDRARAALRGARWAAPEHVRVEVFHAVRGRWLAGKLDRSAAETAVHRLARLAVETVPSEVLLDRMWELRDNLSGYDAAYVAAAEHLGVELVTADRWLNAAPGLRCGVVLV
jgi:predicted nucleic acid-binding protein